MSASVANDAPLSAARARSLANLRPYQPGQSGNPSGRTPRLQTRIRAEIGDDGAELVAFWVAVFRNRNGAMRERLEAARELADRGFGKPLQVTELSGLDGGALKVTLELVVRDDRDPTQHAT